MKKFIAAINRFYSKMWKKIREKIAGRMIARMIREGQFNVISLDAEDELDPDDLRLMTKEGNLLIIE